LMLLVHGAGEHSGRYDHFAEYFTAQGFVVAALDHPGHGRSEGRRAYIARFDNYLDALHRFHQQVSAEFGGLPQFLVGHSMGGLISSHYLLQHQDAFVGCVLSGPLLQTELKPGFVQMTLARTLSAVLPTIGVLQIDASGVSRDPEEVRKYRDDPLVYHGKASARTLVELFDAMDRIQAQAGRIRLPLLLIHGGDDVLASPEGSRFLHAHAASGDKTLRIYPGLYHEIFNEPEREGVFVEVRDWCARVLQEAHHGLPKVVHAG
ncbi:MAG TPA: lysophospholipase, partial [Steroidobacteraceae bacterium]